jgi:hypothetical protein
VKGILCLWLAVTGVVARDGIFTLASFEPLVLVALGCTDKPASFEGSKIEVLIVAFTLGGEGGLKLTPRASGRAGIAYRI